MRSIEIIAGKVRRKFRRRLNQMSGDAPRIFFCHVPKCAGVAITAQIWQSVFDGHNVSTFNVDLNGSLRASKLFSMDRMKVRELILAYNLAIPQNHFGTGHVSCRPDLVENFMDEWNFITILRNPVDRWISEYVYNTYKKSDWAKNTLSIEEYVESERGRITAISFVRYFSSMPENYAENLDEFVDEAIMNLGRFSVLGTVENLDRWCEKFRERYKKTISIPPKNISPNVEVAAKIRSNPSLMKKIQRLCEPDTRIYQIITEQTAHQSTATLEQ